MPNFRREWILALVGIVVGVIEALFVLRLPMAFGAIDSLAEAVTALAFGFLAVVLGITLIGLLAAVIAGLRSNRTRTSTETTETTGGDPPTTTTVSTIAEKYIDPDGLIGAAASPGKLAVLALIGALLLLTGALLGGYRYSSGGLLIPPTSTSIPPAATPMPVTSTHVPPGDGTGEDADEGTDESGRADAQQDATPIVIGIATMTAAVLAVIFVPMWLYP